MGCRQGLLPAPITSIIQEDLMAENGTSIVMYPRHRKRTLSSIDTDNLSVWFGGGILNPYGPTLTVAALERIDEGPQYTIIHMMLNPFSQWMREVGELTLGERCSIEQSFEPLFSLSWGSCPSWLLPQNIISEEFSRKVYARFLASRENGQKLLRGVKQHPGDPVGRLVSEMKQYQTTGVMPKDGKLSEEEALELATLLLEPGIVATEFTGFGLFWKKSIEQTKRNRLLGKPMSHDEFSTLFEILRKSCRF